MEARSAWTAPSRPSAGAQPGTGREHDPIHAVPRDLAPGVLPGPGSRPRRSATALAVGRFAYVFVLVLCVVALVYPLLPRRYESAAYLVIQPTDGDGQTDRTLRQPLDDNALQSEIDLISSPALADRVISDLDLGNDAEFAGGGLRRLMGYVVPATWLPTAAPQGRPELRQRVQDHLQVSRDRKSYTIRLGYWSKDPGKAAAMTSALLAAYLDEQRTRKQASVRHLTDWLDVRSKVLSERYEESRRKAVAFRSESGLIDTGAQVELDQRLQVLSGEAAQARARFIDASTRARSLAAMREAGTLANAPEILASTSIIRLKENMAGALAKTAVWANETQAFDGQIAGESDRIVAAAQTEASNWARREEMLSTEIGDIRARIVRRREAEQKLQDLQRAVDSDRIVLDEALTRQKGMTARAEVVGADTQVISNAEVATGASFPKPFLTLLAALALGSLFGLLAIWRQALAGLRRLATA